jgi:cytochrome c oxidase cbb3-type subunit III
VVKARIFLGVAALVCAIVLAATVQRAAADEDAVSPSTDYLIYCAKCHGTDGKGDGPNASTLKTRPRDFADCAVMKKISDATMFKAIKDGGGSVHVSSEMPPWGQAFDDHEIKGLIAYVRNFCKN